MKQTTKRLISFVLCFVMVMGMLPVLSLGADAADYGTPVDAAIIFSDLHTDEYDYKESTVKEIFGALKNTGLPFSSVTSAGDAFSVNENNAQKPNGKYTGDPTKITGYIHTALGDSSIPVNYVWSEHDRYATGIEKSSGLIEYENYYIYKLSMADVASWDRYSAGFYSQSEITAHIEAFKQTAASLDKSKPLFIAGHQPLFDDRGDNGHAYEWVVAINAVAEDMDVAYFYGHNHNYDDGIQSYYRAKGDTMAVPTTKVISGSGYSTDLASEDVVLNFTHVSAGYLSPESGKNNPMTRKGVAMAITIYEDAIRYTTYNSSGVYTGSYAVDEYVTRDHAAQDEVTPDPSVPETTEPAPSEPTPSEPAPSDPVTPEGDKVYVLVDEPVDGGKYLIVNQTLTNGDLSVDWDVYDDGMALIRSGEAITYAYAIPQAGTIVDAEGNEYAGGYIELDNENAVWTAVATAKGWKLENGGHYLATSGTDSVTASTKATEWTYDAAEDDGRLYSGDKYLYFTYYDADTTKWRWRTGAETGVSSTRDIFFYQEVELEAEAPEVPSEPVEDANGTGITVTAPGVTGVSVVQVEEPEYNHDLYSNYASFDINLEGYEQGTDAIVSIPAPAGFDAERPVVVLHGGETVATTMIEDGLITFGTNHFSVYDVAQFPENDAEEGSVTIDGGEKTAYKLATSVTANKSYLIVNTTTSGTAYALKNNNGSVEATGVTVVNDTNGTYIVLDDATDELWTMGANISSNTNSTLKNGRHYLNVNATGSLSLVTSTGNYTNWRLYGDALYRYRRNYTSYYLRCNNGVWSADTSSQNVYFYEPTKISSGVTYSVAASDLSVNVTAAGETAQLVPELKKDGVTLDDPNGLLGGQWDFYYDANNGVFTLDDDGTVHFNGVSGSAQVKIAYTWTADGETYTAYKYVTVTAKVASNYPEYPDEGAVKVNKTGHGVDFQASGIAQIEISASGVPVKKGVDVILMLDMSSSMDRCTSCGEYVGRYSPESTKCSCSTKTTRVDELKNALLEFETVLDNSENKEDIRIAIADFNGFFGASAQTSGTAYDRVDGDRMSDGNTLSTSNSSYRTGRVYNGATGASVGISADAFVSVDDLNIAKLNSDVFTGKSTATKGTNYDHAFDVIYQLGYAIKEENKANGHENRDLIVIFMSDGAPNQYNYFHAQADSSNWNYWLQGTLHKQSNPTSLLNSRQTHYNSYYDFTDLDDDGFYNEHRMANAIKGDTETKYEVVRKNQSGTGKDAVTSILEPVSGKDDLYKIPGLGATMYSVGFYIKNDGDITKDSVEHVLSQIPSNSDMYIKADDQAALNDAFKQIAGDIVYAAYNARIVDQMGSDFNLQMKTSTYNVNVDGKVTAKTLAPKIEIINYDIYVEGETRPAGKNIGDRKGTYTVLETVTFSADGSKAYSDKIDGGETNILVNGVINAKTFYYNTTDKAVTLSDISIPTKDGNQTTTTGSTSLPAETFYWKMGTVKTSELAMRYYVYLEGSMEGKRDPGSYPTNNYATLYYDNYLGNPCYKDTVSPLMPWKGANVSYAFYLVDMNGDIIVNQASGQTGTFPNRVTIVAPTKYDDILMNSEYHTVTAAEVSGVLGDEYVLFDAKASYQVRVNSNATGDWIITNGNKAATTYVTQYDPANGAAYTNSEKVADTSYDYTHTIVWFPVVFQIEPKPDTVVIDYGLPVEIDVLTNDRFGGKGVLSAVGPELDKIPAVVGTLNTSYGTSYGGAKVNNGKITYTMDDMLMQQAEVVGYAVNYAGSTNPGYYYSTVTVIPATTIYYEDSFVEYSVWNAADDTRITANEQQWQTAGSYANGVQREDRPGVTGSNVYGYDGAYSECSEFSMGSANKVTVDKTKYAEAQFTFAGTGFDVISMTSNMTGAISVDVYTKADFVENGYEGTAVESVMVDTYYGYTKNADGEWVATPDTENSLYQVPVIKVENLGYNTYTVIITVAYNGFFDHQKDGSLDFYLDAIRIYDPTGNQDATSNGAYQADGEAWPVYQELRNNIIAASKVTVSEDKYGNVVVKTAENELTGAIFIDGEDDNRSIADYVSYGPNNELYLDENQVIAFQVSNLTNVADVQLGIKLARGESATYTINGDAYTVKTASDLYYSIYKYAKDGDMIIIENTGAGILSLTNIKVTHTADPGAKSDLLSVDAEGVAAVLMALRPQPVNPFADVTKDQFFYESVLWAVSKGITNGVDAAHFGPYLTCNRAQVVTFLWRAAGSPTPASRVNPFVDVPENSWYTDAVLWAVENGITNGLSADTFGPDALCNRAQVVTFLWRANGSKVVASENPFEDVPADAFYRDAVVWALQNGITTGATATTFDPNGTCMRAHVVTFLYRAKQLPEVMAYDNSSEN